ncbi:MAG: Branched-chain-amino-acid aminotransferase [bacterium ADurb.Bin243]|nr:MAG: Branched-chain-amino-acid aminotransferase [bacterium ADurb.Bin243]HOD39921.1 branched-chain-amino-acid transaminase [Candidatus Wallbacteria bacterium]
MSLKIYVNGEFIDKDKAVVSVSDHGFLYGDGTFEGIRAYKGCIFALREHLDRLYESAKTLMIDMPVTIEEMEKIVAETLIINNFEDAYIRLVVSRGAGDLGLDPRKCSRPTLVVIADKIKLYPEEFYQKGLEVITASVRRTPVDSFNGKVKSLNYLNNILARIEANNAGVGEAIMLNHDGYVAECSADNIFLVKNGEILTPAAHLGLLKGITRDSIIKVARSMGITVTETIFTTHDVYNADEVFLTGTGAEVVAVVRADKRIIGNGLPGPMTFSLRENYIKYACSYGYKLSEHIAKYGKKTQSAS